MANPIHTIWTWWYDFCDSVLIFIFDPESRGQSPELRALIQEERENRSRRNKIVSRLREVKEVDIPEDSGEAKDDTELEYEDTDEDEFEDEDEPPMIPLTRSRTLHEQIVRDEWYAIVRNGAGNAFKVREQIQKKLKENKLQSICRWGVVEARSQGMIGRVRREFIVVQHNHFTDFNQYIGIRDLCTYLDCCRFCVLEPGMFKRYASTKLIGDEAAISSPKNILANQDLHAWNSIISDIVREAVTELVEQLGQDTNSIPRNSKGILGVW